MDTARHTVSTLKVGQGKPSGRRVLRPFVSLQEVVLFAVSLCFGITIPLILFLPVYFREDSEAYEFRASKDVHVAVGDPDTVTSKLKSTEITLEAEPDSMEEFVKKQGVTIAPRQFHYASGTERSEEPKFIFKNEAEKNSSGPKSSNVRPAHGFALNTPKKNLDIGGAYTTYLSKTFGSELENHIVPQVGKGAELLPKISKKRASQPIK